MIRSCNIRAVCIVGFVLTVVLLALAADATPSESSPGGSTALANHPNEIAVAGAVERLVSHSTSGGPAGFHLFVSISGKTIDAHLGPFLSKQNQEALVAGQPVQVIGINTSIRGKDVLLARQLIFARRLVIVRNERGALVRERPARRATSKPAVTGGAQ